MSAHYGWNFFLLFYHFFFGFLNVKWSKKLAYENISNQGYLEGNQGKPCPQPQVDIQVLLPSKSDSMGVGP